MILLEMYPEEINNELVLESDYRSRTIVKFVFERGYLVLKSKVSKPQ